MLDKTAEKVLRRIIENYDGDAEKDINIFPRHFDMSYTELNSLCHSLQKQGFLSTYWYSSHNDGPTSVRLSHEGLHYFEMKRRKLIDNLMRSVLIPIIVTLLTQLAIFLLKQLLPLIQELLSNTP